MDKGVAVALSDELLNTVIHRFQIPGSGIQLEVQAIAIKELMHLVEQHSSIKFLETTYELVDRVKGEMPACFGTVPDSFYQLRRDIENALSEDGMLQCVVKVISIRGNREDLFYQLPVLQNPDIPQEFKDEMMDGGIVSVIDDETLDAALRLVELLCPKKRLVETQAYLCFGRQAASEGTELKIATAYDWEKLRSMDLDIVGMMELGARIDQVLDTLFRNKISSLYDKKGGENA